MERTSTTSLFVARDSWQPLSQHWGLVSVHRLFCYTTVEAPIESETIAALCACYAVKVGRFT